LFSPFDCFVMIAIRKDKQWPATAKLYLNLQKEWYTNENMWQGFAEKGSWYLLRKGYAACS